MTMSDTAPPPRIMASMLTADFTALGDQCRALARAGIDGIHWDVMDGVAVPSISFGPDIIAACRHCVDLPFEVHVMSHRPENVIADLAAAGCEAMVIHPDWIQNPRRALQLIADAGMAPGVALSPGTPVELARWHLDLVDRVVVMTVEPGYGGQVHIAAMADKVRDVVRLARGASQSITVEVDGGIGPSTISGCRTAGADCFVVGSALWRAATFDQALHELRTGAGA